MKRLQNTNYFLCFAAQAGSGPLNLFHDSFLAPYLPSQWRFLDYFMVLWVFHRPEWRMEPLNEPTVLVSLSGG